MVRKASEPLVSLTVILYSSFLSVVILFVIKLSSILTLKKIFTNYALRLHHNAPTSVLEHAGLVVLHDTIISKIIII